MKTFVFLTKRITEIGGAEQYIFNKQNYLKKLGWRVLIFSGNYGNILVNDFKQYEDMIYTQLQYPPVCYSGREVFKIVNEIADRIKIVSDGDECIIESESVGRALWAELIASKIGCKHFAFPVQEEFFSTDELKSFLRFKYDRHELAGITQKSVNQMFDDSSLEYRADSCFKAFCNNVIEESEDRFSDKLNSDADYTIGSIGRLCKECVIPLLEGVKTFISSHPDKKFNLVLIGGQADKRKIGKIKEMFSGLGNVSLLMTGDVYPIPRSFVDNIDVFVSTAGSATATYRYGKPTIKVHPVNGKPVGIVGADFDLKEKSMFNTDRGLSVSGCLQRVLVDGIEIEYKYPFGNEYYEIMETEFGRQLGIEQREEKRDYYPDEMLLKIYPRSKSRKYFKLISFAGHILGGRIMTRIMNLVGKN